MTAIDIRDIDKYIRAGSQGVKSAGVQVLNTVAFKSLPDLVNQAAATFKFRQDPRGAMGWQVDKATRSNMQAVVRTNRKWLKPHIQQGVRSPVSGGWVFNGREYIVIPVLKAAFGKGGVLKSGYLANLYVVARGSGALVFYRLKRGAKASQLLALLRPTVATRDEINPDIVIQNRFDATATQLLRRYLASPQYKANPKGVF